MDEVRNIAELILIVGGLRAQREQHYHSVNNARSPLCRLLVRHLQVDHATCKMDFWLFAIQGGPLALGLLPHLIPGLGSVWSLVEVGLGPFRRLEGPISKHWFPELGPFLDLGLFWGYKIMES